MPISVVQTASSNTTTVTFGANTTIGNTVVVCVSSFSGATSISGITLGGSADNFAQAVTPAVSGNSWAGIWQDINCGQASTTVIVSGSNLVVSAGGGGIVAFEISGVSSADTAGRTSQGGNSGNFSSGTAGPTTSANEIWIGDVNTTASIGTPDATFTNTTFSFAAAGWKIVSATGNPVYSGTCASGAWAAAVIALAAPGAAGISGTVPVLMANQIRVVSRRDGRVVRR